jgi:hypothetical protein
MPLRGPAWRSTGQLHVRGSLNDTAAEADEEDMLVSVWFVRTLGASKVKRRILCDNPRCRGDRAN